MGRKYVLLVALAFSASLMGIIYQSSRLSVAELQERAERQLDSFENPACVTPLLFRQGDQVFVGSKEGENSLRIPLPRRVVARRSLDGTGLVLLDARTGRVVVVRLQLSPGLTPVPFTWKVLFFTSGDAGTGLSIPMREDFAIEEESKVVAHILGFLE